MAVSYAKLWKLLIDKRLKRYNLKEITGISSSTLAKLGKDEYVSMESIERICKALDTEIGNVVEFVAAENSSRKK
jgi:DNA (cytosine-5)-methyltransferase 1